MESTGLVIPIPTIVWTIINFVILVLLLKHFFWNKIKEIIESRENEVEEKLIKADEDSEKARLYLIQNERILKQAKNEGKTIIEERKKKAEKIHDEIIENAKKEANSIIERAKLDVSREKEKAEYEIKKQAVDIAVELSLKALEDQIDKDLHRQLIKDFITKAGI